MMLQAPSRSVVACWSFNWPWSVNWSHNRICSGDKAWANNWAKNWSFNWIESYGWSWRRCCSRNWSQGI